MDVRLTFLQDIFEAVSSASILHCRQRTLARPPARPDFYADNPVNSRSLSIFYVDLYSSALLPPLLLLCGKQRKETSPTGNMGKTKKAAVASVGHDLRTRAVPRRRGEQAAGERAEHTKHPLYNSGRSAARQTTLLAERSASCLAKGYAHGETAS